MVATAPSAQLLFFPLRPDLRRHARTPRARVGVRVAAERARHAGAGPHAGRGTHARRHGAAASPGGGWGARGRAEGARGEGRAEFDSRRAYGTLSRNPCTSAAIIPPPLPASRLEGGSTSAGVGARRALGIVAAIWGRRGNGGRHRGYQPSPSIRKAIPIPVKITCEWEREEWLRRTTWNGRAARAAARCGRRGDARQAEVGAVARGNLGSNSWRGTYDFHTKDRDTRQTSSLVCRYAKINQPPCPLRR